MPCDKKIIVTCAVGLRGFVAARLLMQHEFNVYNLDGGLKSAFGLGENEELEQVMAISQSKEIIESDVVPFNECALQCPRPILKVNEQMKVLNDGDVLEVRASDPGFIKDIEKSSQRMNHTFISAELAKGVVTARVVKGSNAPLVATEKAPTEKVDATMVVFSGDMDKVLASFIIANGAAAMGKEVTMFFTFWGLNALRKPEAPKVQKDMIEKMFGMMMPKGASKLQLSKMNMGGMGSVMMKHVMKQKNVNTLDELIQTALQSGVKLVACTMSMDVMGIKEEELIDGVDFGGVASYLAETDDSNLNLFV